MDDARRMELLKRAEQDKRDGMRNIKGYSSEAYLDEKTGEYKGRLVKNLGGPGPTRWAPSQETWQQFHAIAPLKKRTENQRVDSLALKFQKAIKNHNPGEMELILQKMAAEGWKTGSPVSYEEIRRVAIEEMRKAAAKAAEKKLREF